MAQVYIKKCPKCRGDLIRYPTENLTECLQCSKMLTQIEELMILGIAPPPLVKEAALPPVKRGRPPKRRAA